MKRSVKIICIAIALLSVTAALASCKAVRFVDCALCGKEGVQGRWKNGTEICNTCFDSIRETKDTMTNIDIDVDFSKFHG